MAFIREPDIIDYLIQKKLVEFIKTRTESEQDMFKIGLLCHTARTANIDKIVLHKKLSPMDEEDLRKFKRMERKYKFSYLKPLTKKELELEKEQLLSQGIVCG